MVVSCLPAGCRVNASASRPLDSASATTSAYQRTAAYCLLAHFFPFASVCWLVIASPLVAPPPPCIAFRRTAASRVHPRPPLFVSAGWLLRRVASCCTTSASRRATGSRVASCGTFALHPPACPLLHHNFRRPLSWRSGHHRHPQMHGALSRRRHRQRPLFPLVRLLTSNTSTFAAALSSLQLNHPPSLPNSRHILEEGDDVEDFYVCLNFTLICESRSTVPPILRVW